MITQEFFSDTRHQKRSLAGLNEYFGNEVAGKKNKLATKVGVLELPFNKILLISLLFWTGCKKEGSPQIQLNAATQKVELFGEDIISTRLYERDIAISPDGTELIYTLGNYRQSFRCLVSIKKGVAAWQEKQLVSFTGRYQDIEPFFSTDGTKLFFASTRPMDSDTTRSDYNIWFSKKTALGWGDPSPLDTIINTSKDEFYPAVSKNGNLYFTATRENGIGREDIFLSTFNNGKYQSPVPLDSTVNSAAFEFNAYVNPDEDLMVFSSYGRDDGLGGGDLYYSRRDANGRWTEAKNMGPVINSDKLDYCPFIDVPRGNFYFTSERGNALDKELKTVGKFEEEANRVLNGLGNIYRVNIEALDLK